MWPPNILCLDLMFMCNDCSPLSVTSVYKIVPDWIFYYGIKWHMKYIYIRCIIVYLYVIYIYRQRSTFLAIHDKHGRLQFFIIIKLCGILLYRACNQFLNRLSISYLNPLWPNLWQFRIIPLPRILWFWKFQIIAISEQLILRALKVSVDTFVHVYQVTSIVMKTLGGWFVSCVGKVCSDVIFGSGASCWTFCFVIT
jgi:hypothetical protein